MADPDAPVLVAPYDPKWRGLFERERILLENLLAPWLAGPIEHVGSTAVPGLPAKPVIDIMAAVGDLGSSRAAIPILAAAEYSYAPYRAEVEHWFCKPKPSARTHHLHLVPYASRVWSDMILFRDILRREPATAQSYVDLKLRLAQAHRRDREAYTDGKKEFVLSVVQNARG